MMRRFLLILILLLVAIPSVLYARWIKDKVYMETKAAGQVEFSHFVHLEAVGKDCPTCHNEIYHIIPKNNPAYTMAQMEEGKACGVCHNGKKAFSVAGDCAACHGGDVEISHGAGASVSFSHEVHTEAFGCDDCHPDLFKPMANSNKATMKQMEDGASCGACHDGDTAFGVSGDCATCHTKVPEVAIRSDVGTIPFSHSVHQEMFGCDECHPDLFKAVANGNQHTMAQMEKGESCGACHDGDTAFGVSGDCGTCHVGAEEITITTENVGTVTFSHEVHTDMFGCGECHPDVFKPQANGNKATMKQMEKGASCGACHDGDSAFGVKEDCTSCHAGDIEYKNEDAGNITFPHSAHIEMFGCDDCHPDLFVPQKGANKATMEAMENGESCGACHDGDSAFGVAEDCESCHAM